MLTYKLKIRNSIDITGMCRNYSYMFRKLFTNFELSQDKEFAHGLQAKYNLDSWFYDSCKNEVEAKLNQIETFNKNNAETLEHLNKQLSDNEFKGDKGKRSKYYVIKKINSLKSAINRNISFGTRVTLQRISFLSNPVKNETEEQREQRLKELKSVKEQYQNSRILPLSIVGETLRKGNRKFDFDLTNNKVVFKPKNKVNIPIEYRCSKRQKQTLEKLQTKIGEMPISIRLNNDYIWFMFDEQKLSGYSFDKKAYFDELKTIPKKDKALRSLCYKRHIWEQEQRMIQNKIKDRYIGFDLNPEFIGVAIMENDTLIHKEVISLESLNTKKGLSSTDTLQVYQNNKRTHELNHVWKHIFEIAKHYKVAHCVIEDLNFKAKGVNNDHKEFNRKTKNLWHRERTVQLITKYCNLMGLKLLEVNPCYSSFIGNIKNDYYDPLSSAIEICRRGQTKYLKGGFYPNIERKDIDTMCHLGLDVPYNTVSTWVKLYQLFKTAKLRYRRELNNFVENNLHSYKSDVKLYQFYTL